MSKKCPPGVICFENMTFLFLVLIVAYILYQVVYIPHVKNTLTTTLTSGISNEVSKYTYSYPQILISTKSEPSYSIPNNGPITVNTQRMELHYRQVGILTRQHHKEVILPLYGRMVNTSRTKWQYYTMNDSNNHVRLPIHVNGKSANDEYGVDELYNGDTVYVQGYEDIFRVTIYENNRFTYTPI